MKRPLPFLLGLMLMTAACREQPVNAYRAPKDKLATLPSAATPAGDMAGAPVATSDNGPLTWTLPTHWRTKPAVPPRKASFTVPGITGGTDGDLSVTAFPGDVGGLLANLNRWRTQIQLPPLSAPDLQTATTDLSANGLTITVVDFAGPGTEPGAPRILGAIVPVDGATWFFKLTGPRALLEQEKSAFLSFLNSVRPAATP